MAEDISLPVVIIIFFVVLALFVMARTFQLPAQFYANQEKRNKMRKKLREKDKSYTVEQ